MNDIIIQVIICTVLVIAIVVVGWITFLVIRIEEDELTIKDEWGEIKE